MSSKVTTVQTAGKRASVDSQMALLAEDETAIAPVL
jgi:hypothetical protein